MDQVELRLGKRIADHIMDPQLHVAGIPDVDPVEVEVGRNDATGFADTSRQLPDD